MKPLKLLKSHGETAENQEIRVERENLSEIERCKQNGYGTLNL